LKWEEIKNWISEKLQYILMFWSLVIGPLLQGDWETTWTNMKAILKKVLDETINKDLPDWWNSLISWWKNAELMNDLRPILNDLGLAMAEAILRGLWEALKGGITLIFRQAKEWFQQGWQDTGWSTATWGEFWNNFKQNFTDYGFGNPTGYGDSSQTNLPDQGHSFGGDHFNKRGGASAPSGGRTMVVNNHFHGITNPSEIVRLIERSAQRGAFA
jgi:hypothetical protein